MPPIRTSSVFALLLLGLAAAGCGSSTNTSTAPSSLERCGVTVKGGGTLPASGGSATLDVTAARECEWSAATNTPWLTIKGGARGQGNGSVELAANANPDPAVRRGAVVLNDQQLEVAQAAGECVFTLGERSVTVPRAGGPGQIEVRASSPLCTWTAEPQAEWIDIKDGASGKGSGQVRFEVSAASGPPRTGTIRVAGLEFEIQQSEGCVFSLDPPSHEAGSGGGTGSVGVVTAAGCQWTAVSTVDWITLSRDGGTGPASVSFTVAATSGARTGTATIAGRTFTVTQSAAPAPAPSPAPSPAPGPAPAPAPTPTPTCSYAAEPKAFSVAAAGETITVRVSTGNACAWEAASGASWITLSRAAASGAGTAIFTVAPASGAARTGTVTVAGQTVTVSQAAACSYSVKPDKRPVDHRGGPVKTTVETANGCAWTATSTAAWLEVVSGASGSGKGEVTVNAAANDGAARSGVVNIAGSSFTVEQAAAPEPDCRVRLRPDRLKVSENWRIQPIEVRTSRGCAWEASTDASWIHVVLGHRGVGDGLITLSIDRNDGKKREGRVVVGSETLRVEQEGDKDDDRKDDD